MHTGLSILSHLLLGSIARLRYSDNPGAGDKVLAEVFTTLAEGKEPGRQRHPLQDLPHGGKHGADHRNSLKDSEKSHEKA